MKTTLCNICKNQFSRSLDDGAFGGPVDDICDSCQQIYFTGDIDLDVEPVYVDNVTSRDEARE